MMHKHLKCWNLTKAQTGSRAEIESQSDGEGRQFPSFARCCYLWRFCRSRGWAQISGKSGADENLPSAPQPQFTRKLKQMADASAGCKSRWSPPCHKERHRDRFCPMHLKRLRRRRPSATRSHAFDPHTGRTVGPQEQSSDQCGASACAWHSIRSIARPGRRNSPIFNGAITAVDANEGSRIGAGALTASRLLEHAGAGVTLSQLITDFGRTTNLVSYSKLLEKAQNANALATTEDIVLATDQAFYNALAGRRRCSRSRNKR